MPHPSQTPEPAVRAALELLNIRHLLFGIHDPAFPSLPEEDTGRGSPYTDGAQRFLGFVRALGFDGVQLGPQGLTAPGNPSPYDGTLFSRNPLSLALLPLTRPQWGRLLAPAELAAVLDEPGGDGHRVDYRRAHACTDAVLTRILGAWRGGAGAAVRWRAEFEKFRGREAGWLQRDALYQTLADGYGGRGWRDWPEELDRLLWAPPEGRQADAVERRRQLRERHAREIEAYSFIQCVLHAQQRAFQAETSRLGLKLFADLQIGMSVRDAWFAQGFCLPGYRLGAPPSRTNPAGQPWGYAVLDPRRYAGAGGRGDGPALAFLQLRMEKLFREFDGVRVDHPHGLVCPWVYAADQADALQAVQSGARLFAAPDLPDHPALAAFAIARADQLDRSLPRHADGWVRELTADQVDRYAVLFEAVVGAARANRREVDEIACEVLSTQPYPLQQVLARHGLGRFRVTQKVDLSRLDDVYRSENARPEDWIMLGNHDTRTIWTAAEEWCRDGTAPGHARYLAERLLSPREHREGWAERVAADPAELAQAKFAELFAGPARNVMVYFTDLLGYREPYNRPGMVSAENWSLRVSRRYRDNYAEHCREGRALDLPKALARALRGKPEGAPEGLVPALERLAQRPGP